MIRRNNLNTWASRRTGVGRAEWKSFATNVPVAKKLICRGFERYSRQSFGPNVRYLHWSRALYSTEDSVLIGIAEWSRHEEQQACCAHVNSRCALKQHDQRWLFKIVWTWRLPHAVRRACLKCNIISDPVVTDTKVFVTTIIGTFRRNSRQNWQSVTRTASETWEIELVKEISRDVKLGDSLINLIIEIHRIKFRCTTSSSSFRKGRRQNDKLMQRSPVLHLCHCIPAEETVHAYILTLLTETSDWSKIVSTVWY